ncbi:MAG: N-acetylmuramoyl-L-alanine amidase [Phycisphaerales bacterium]
MNKKPPDQRAVIHLLACLIISISGCQAGPRGTPVADAAAAPAVGTQAARIGDEIVAAGVRFHTGAPVVLWTDPGGYDAYRVHRRFVRPDDLDQEHELDGRPRFGVRRAPGDESLLPARRSGDWTLEELREVVDQFVLHYDVCGTSRTCFRVLHDARGLSVHFLLDVDGTIYQTLDLEERAWHATKANDRSIGIEIANIGAYSIDDPATLDDWYASDRNGATVMTLPERFGDGGIRTPGFRARPIRSERIRGTINGRDLVMYDLTAEQYDSLAKLTATLNAIFPKIELDAPRDTQGAILTGTLSDPAFDEFAGVLGHFHVQDNKVDPGPAFQWDRVLDEARVLRGSESSTQ